MAEVREAQVRLLYSLLKPAVRAAARFHVPMRTLSELVRLAYFEHLQREGLSQAEIARRFGQTDRHMRSLAKRVRSDFFAAEHEVGLVREVENLVASRRYRLDQLAEALPQATQQELAHAIEELLEEQRIEAGPEGTFQAPARYHVLRSDRFVHRVDALNHFLDGVYHAVVHRLVLDEKQGAMLKAISFVALPRSLDAFVARIEGELRRGIAALEEEAQFEGKVDARYVLSLGLAPSNEAAPVGPPATGNEPAR